MGLSKRAGLALALAAINGCASIDKAPDEAAAIRIANAALKEQVGADMFERMTANLEITAELNGSRWTVGPRPPPPQLKTEDGDTLTFLQTGFRAWAVVSKRTGRVMSIDIGR